MERWVRRIPISVLAEQWARYAGEFARQDWERGAAADMDCPEAIERLLRGYLAKRNRGRRACVAYFRRSTDAELREDLAFGRGVSASVQRDPAPGRAVEANVGRLTGRRDEFAFSRCF